MKKAIYQLTATLCFFTRLPFWRLVQVPKEYYKRVVPYWPFAGWVTGSLMALTCIATSCFPIHISVILALAVRCLATGALHEDGYADFCDGFGGGYDRQKILSIMKDSHIGTYGVLGLILYFALQISTMSHVLGSVNNRLTLFLLIVVADSTCKFISSTIVHVLPYARTEETSKNKLVYATSTIGEIVTGLLTAALPIALIGICFPDSGWLYPIGIAVLAASISAALLFYYMKKKIQGYTGDCCGATFIITEAVFYLALLSDLSNLPLFSR